MSRTDQRDIEYLGKHQELVSRDEISQILLSLGWQIPICFTGIYRYRSKKTKYNPQKMHSEHFFHIHFVKNYAVFFL